MNYNEKKIVIIYFHIVLDRIVNRSKDTKRPSLLNLTMVFRLSVFVRLPNRIVQKLAVVTP